MQNTPLRLPLLILFLLYVTVTTALSPNVSRAVALPPGAADVTPDTTTGIGGPTISHSDLGHSVAGLTIRLEQNLLSESAPPPGLTPRDFQHLIILRNSSSSSGALTEFSLSGFAERTGVEITYVDAFQNNRNPTRASRSADGNVITIYFDGAPPAGEAIEPDGNSNSIYLRYDGPAGLQATGQLVQANGVAVPTDMLYRNPVPALPQFNIRTSHTAGAGKGLRTFERFVTNIDSQLGIVRWRGGYLHEVNTAANPPLPNTNNWAIEFWEGEDLLASPLIENYVIPASEVSTTFVENFDFGSGLIAAIYDFEAELPPGFIVSRNQIYWIGITSLTTTFQPIFAWWGASPDADDDRSIQQNFATNLFVFVSRDRILELAAPEPGFSIGLMAGLAMLAGARRRRGRREV